MATCQFTARTTSQPDSDALSLLLDIDRNVDAATETGLRFRLPYPDEDECLPGEYTDWNRGLRLYRVIKEGARPFTEDYAPDWLATADSGSIHLRHEASGLSVSVPCHHGHRLPEIGPNARAIWNGKGHSIELVYVKRTVDGVVPVLRCRHCGNLWRDTWENVLPFVPGETLRNRLARHQKGGRDHG